MSTVKIFQQLEKWRNFAQALTVIFLLWQFSSYSSLTEEFASTCLWMKLKQVSQLLRCLRKSNILRCTDDITWLATLSKSKTTFQVFVHYAPIILKSFFQRWYDLRDVWNNWEVTGLLLCLFHLHKEDLELKCWFQMSTKIFHKNQSTQFLIIVGRQVEQRLQPVWL